MCEGECSSDYINASFVNVSDDVMFTKLSIAVCQNLTKWYRAGMHVHID